MITTDDKGKLRVLEVVFTNNDDVLGVVYKNKFYPVGKPRKSQEPIQTVHDAYGKLIWIIENEIIYTASKSGNLYRR